jgi:hypothetical protein
MGPFTVSWKGYFTVHLADTSFQFWCSGLFLKSDTETCSTGYADRQVPSGNLTRTWSTCNLSFACC